MAAFFSRVAYKPTAEWKEEIVILDPAPAGPVDGGLPRRHDGDASPPDEDPARRLRRLADHARQPVVRAQRREPRLVLAAGPRHHPRARRHPPRQPARRTPSCWPAWSGSWSRSDYDLKHLFRLILNSRTYQQSSIPRSDHPDAEALFAHYPVRRLDAEVLIDALCRLDGRGENYVEPDPRAVHLHPRGRSGRSRWPTAASPARSSRCSAARRATPAWSRSATTSPPTPSGCTC